MGAQECPEHAHVTLQQAAEQLKLLAEEHLLVWCHLCSLGCPIMVIVSCSCISTIACSHTSRFCSPCRASLLSTNKILWGKVIALQLLCSCWLAKCAGSEQATMEQCPASRPKWCFSVTLPWLLCITVAPASHINLLGLSSQQRGTGRAATPSAWQHGWLLAVHVAGR